MATPTAKSLVRGRAPKCEVLEEFSRISQEIEGAREAADGKAPEAAAMREAERRLAELRLRTLAEMVALQADQIATLERQLKEAEQEVQDIAVKAIEAASDAKASAAINQIAMEQARQRPRAE